MTSELPFSLFQEISINMSNVLFIDNKPRIQSCGYWLYLSLVTSGVRALFHNTFCGTDQGIIGLAGLGSFSTEPDIVYFRLAE